MKSMKRTIAMLLTLALVFASFPLGAFAEQELVAERSSEVEGVSSAEPQTEVKQEAQEETPLKIGPEEEKQALRAPAGETKKMYISVDYASYPGESHRRPGGQGQMGDVLEAMYKNLDITVTGPDGKTFESPKYFADTEGKPNKYVIVRYLGEWPVGSELEIKIDSGGLYQPYHLAYTDPVEGLIVEGGYDTLKVRCDAVNEKNKGKDGSFLYPVRFNIGQMKVKFDPKGGQLNGKTAPIESWVKTDSSVEFPNDPVKKGLTFSGWYTEFPSNYPNANKDRRVFWTADDKYSDTDRDFKWYNDTRIDPKQDGVFLLRALWKARVTYDTKGGSPTPDSVMVDEGKTISKPATDPQKKTTSSSVGLMLKGMHLTFSRQL